MNRATIKSANRAIAKAGIPVELVRGEGYHYFVFDDGKRFETVSIYVPYTNTVGDDRWVEWARDAYAEINGKK